MGLGASTPNQTLFDQLPKDLQWLQMLYLEPDQLFKHPLFNKYRRDREFQKLYLNARFNIQRNYCQIFEATANVTNQDTYGDLIEVCNDETAKYNLLMDEFQLAVDQYLFMYGIYRGDLIIYDLGGRKELYFTDMKDHRIILLPVKDNIIPFTVPDEFPIDYFMHIRQNYNLYVTFNIKEIKDQIVNGMYQNSTLKIKLHKMCSSPGDVNDDCQNYDKLYICPSIGINCAECNYLIFSYYVDGYPPLYQTNLAGGSSNIAMGQYSMVCGTSNNVGYPYQYPHQHSRWY